MASTVSIRGRSSVIVVPFVGLSYVACLATAMPGPASAWWFARHSPLQQLAEIAGMINGAIQRTKPGTEGRHPDHECLARQSRGRHRHNPSCIAGESGAVRSATANLLARGGMLGVEEHAAGWPSLTNGVCPRPSPGGSGHDQATHNPTGHTQAMLTDVPKARTGAPP